MKKHSRVTAFYCEALLLIVVFVSILLVLTQIFGLGRRKSEQARLKNNAVCLCANAAEAVSCADSPEALAALLDEGGNVRASGEGRLLASYDADMHPDPAGRFVLELQWSEEPGPGGTLARAEISACYNGGEPLYRLETVVLLTEVGP